MLSPLAVDIETVGVSWNDLDEETRTYLMHRGRTDRTEEETKDRLALNPGTGRVVAIGMWRPDEDKGGLLLETEADSPEAEWVSLEDNRSIYRGSETQILEEFWRYVSSGVGRIITYNGRAFDGPFLTLRSALLGVKPTRSFLPYRYSFRRHCDLAEVVSFHGARGLETLDFWCRRAGIGSPKSELDGSQVGAAYQRGEIEKIGEYCLRDARATAKLFEVLKPVVDVLEGSSRS
ncbi:MAG: ribonuclease H-like domain-containing protein [Candidatus Bipolaricaulota bacterium]